MYGIIYKATNKINGKIYIGRTTQTLKRRMQRHYQKARHDEKISVFLKAINKYGEENFDWETIDTANSEEELNEKEIFWIKKYNSYINAENSNGYNMSIGGETNTGWKASKEQLKKWYARSGENHPNYGKKGEEMGMYGKHHTKEAREKMRKNRKGIKRTDEMRKKDSEVKIGVYANENNPRAKAVVKLTKEGEFIEYFPTAKQGAESVNGKRSAITNCCNGYAKTSYGFKWVFADEYEGEVNERPSTN